MKKKYAIFIIMIAIGIAIYAATKSADSIKVCAPYSCC